MSDFWLRLRTQLFDEGGVEEIFSHLRNLLIATFIVAAGSYVIKQQADVEILGVLNLEIAGFGVATVGIILVALNMLDGFYKLTKLGSPIALRIALLALYFFISLRLIQFIVLFRAG